MAHIRSGEAPVEVGGVRVTAVGIDVRADVHHGQTARQRGASIAGGSSSIDAVLARAGIVEATSLEVDVSGTAAGAPRTRGAAAPPGVVRLDVPVDPDAGSLLLVEEDGVLHWVLPKADPPAAARGLASATRTFELPVEVGESDGPATRGLVGALAKRVVRVLSFKLLDDALGKVGDYFVDRWERTHRPYRLRTFTPDDYLLPLGTAYDADRLEEVARGGRALLVVHGTSSLTHSGFGLLPGDAVRALNDRYDGRVIAFDHPTLAPTPTQNAEWLRDALPTGIGLDVDILCHSRGGLVARVLAERGADIGIDPSTLRVSSVTFVGTPNRGTALCDRAHLTHLVDSFTNLLDLVPDNPVVDAVSGLVEMLKQLAVGAYGGLDGAMSMDPAGAFLRDLNSGPRTTATYRAIAADYEPAAAAPVARRFRDQLMDRVFGEPNDLIVPTESVYGENGSPMFPIADALVLPTDRAVDHSSFWLADPVLDAFERWLPAETAPAGARAASAATPEGAPVTAREESTPAEPEATTKPVLDVRVLHASVESASHLVLVGHYDGSPIAGAEAYLDARLRGRLTRRQLVGLYPGELGDVLVVEAEDDDLVPGAIVIGLGPRGELSPSNLAKAVTRSVLTYALEHTDSPTATPTGISAVLIGTHGADGLLIESSVQAIVEGTASALRTLAEQRPDSPVPINEIEIIEVFAQRAHRAAHAVRRLKDFIAPSLREFVTINAHDYLDEGGGARGGDLPIEYDTGSWRRLVVACRDSGADDGRIELDFTSLGTRARADRLTQSVDRVLLEQLIADAMSTSIPAVDINRTLFEMLFPADLKHDLATIDKLHLVVDDTAADFPWELLADRDAPNGSEALAIRAGMLRQLQLSERRHLDRTVTPETAAIVIGNPPGGAAYPFLDGAVTESLAVIDTLGARGYDVDPYVWDGQTSPNISPAGLSSALLNHDYRIVHIAAHGNYEPPAADGTPRGGVVIGDGVYLTATTIGQMRRPPDLVFLNCCHLGRIGAIGTDEAASRTFAEQQLNRLAASVARVLMRCGVRAVLAAGWPVMDTAATTFARAFYSCMLDGYAYGDAVCEARKQAYEVDTVSNTWAAYQCYGDPAFRLATPTRTAPTRIQPVAPEELTRILEDLAVDAGDPGVDNSVLLAQVHELEARVNPAWRARADVLAAFAATYAELREFETSVHYYREALQAENATMPIRGVEQLANLSVRHAVALHRRTDRASSENAATVDALFSDAERRLTALLELGDTAERRALLGSLYKRWAGVSNRRELVLRAIEQYLRADLPWTRLNALQLAAVSDAELSPELDAELERHRRWLASYAPAAGADYWNRVEPADAELTAALVANALPDQVDVIIEHYRDVFRNRSTPRERDATTTHLDDLASIAIETKRAGLERLCLDLRDVATRPAAVSV